MECGRSVLDTISMRMVEKVETLSRFELLTLEATHNQY